MLEISSFANFMVSKKFIEIKIDMNFIFFAL